MEKNRTTLPSVCLFLSWYVEDKIWAWFGKREDISRYPWLTICGEKLPAAVVSCLLLPGLLFLLCGWQLPLLSSPSNGNYNYVSAQIFTVFGSKRVEVFIF